MADASGSGNTGPIGSATWTSLGRFGNALVLQRAVARVTVPDCALAAICTTAMTLEAWVFPTALGGWRDVIYKGDDNYYLSASSRDRVAAGRRSHLRRHHGEVVGTAGTGAEHVDASGHHLGRRRPCACT